MTRIAALLGILAFVWPVAAAADGDLASLRIDARRLTVMMQQTDDNARVLGIIVPPDDLTERSGPFDDLSYAVERHNDLLSLVCGSLALGDALCDDDYTPDWYLAKRRIEDVAKLRAMTDEAAAHLIPFWKAVCDRTPKPVGGFPVCPME